MENLNSRLNREIAKSHQLFEDYFSNDEIKIAEILEFLLNQRSKKIRPRILLLVAELAGGINDLSTKCATILEALHTASLIHDDIIDLAKLRRGEKSINHQFGNKLAVLTGDYLLSRSLKLLAREKNTKIIEVYAHAAEELCLGEILEQRQRDEDNYSVKTYFEIIRKKTASLFIASAEIGVLTAGGAEKLQQKMSEFAKFFGIAFQLKDDLLDFLGDEEVTGKETGKDLTENVWTYPVLAALQAGNDNESIIQALETNDFHRLKKLIAKNQGFEKTKAAIESYSNKALDILNKLNDCDALRELQIIVQQNITRNK